MAMGVWGLAPEMVERLSLNGSMDAKEWLFDMHGSLCDQEFKRLTVTLWAIWSARRKAIHKDIFQSPLSTHCFIKRFLDEIKIL